MRTKSLIVSLVLVLAVALSACGPAVLSSSANAPDRTLNVTGAGQVSLTPDIAYIYVGVHTEMPSAADAVAENNDQTTQLIAAIKKFGIDENDIRTTNFSIWPFDKYDPITGQSTGEKYYAVDNTVYVTVRKLESLGDLLDAMLQAGANNINSIGFDVADKTEAIKQARAKAVESAKDQAQELADAAGVTLGEIITISFYDAIPYPVADGYGKGGGGGGDGAALAVPIQPGQLTITVTVNMTYAIK